MAFASAIAYLPTTLMIIRTLSVFALLVLIGCTKGSLQGDRGSTVPRFEVDPFWPRTLPNHWMLGEVSGVSVDRNDHIWIFQRPGTLTERETAAAQSPAASECCVPAPSVIEFDQEGNVIHAWGREDSTRQWFTSEHGLQVDGEGNVWLSGSNIKDDVVLKMTGDGRQVIQIGEWGKSMGSNDTDHLGGPADIAVDLPSNEVYVSDGYRNRRIIVFDALTGKYKRHWGAYGDRPDDSPLLPYQAEETPIHSFRNPHAVVISKDGLVYVADRPNNRIQVFTKDGKFQREGFLAKATLMTGAIWDMAFSQDEAQTYIYVADGMNMKIWIVQRSTLEVVGSFGEGGRNAGQLGWVHNLATDSKGNLYTVEVTPGRRIQKFKLMN